MSRKTDRTHSATAPAVSRYLGRFAERSDPDNASSSGFEAWDPKEEHGGVVIVEHRTGDRDSRLTQAQQEKKIENGLSKYAGVLRIRYDVELDMRQQRLVVRTREDER